MSLIPKRENPIYYSDFRPICNFFSKIFIEVLAKRLGPILSKIILPLQGAFIKARETSDNINLALEITKRIDKKNKGGNVVFKL